MRRWASSYKNRIDGNTKILEEFIMTNEKQSAFLTQTVTIHSCKIAQQIINAGQPVITIEANHNKRGKLVFIFEQTQLVTDVLERNKRYL